MRLLALMDLECSSQLSREMLEGDFTGLWCSSRPAYNGSWPPSQATVDTSGNKYMQVLRTILSPGESPHLEILQRWLNQRQTKVGIQKSRPLSSRWGPLLEPWTLQSSPRIWSPCWVQLNWHFCLVSSLVLPASCPQTCYLGRHSLRESLAWMICVCLVPKLKFLSSFALKAIQFLLLLLSG